MKTRMVAIGELATSEQGAFKTGPFGTVLKKSDLVEHGIPVVGIENVLPNNFVPLYRRFLSPQKFSELSHYAIKPGDVLVTRMGTIGRAAVVPNGTKTAIIDFHLFRMRVDTSKVHPPFLCYGLQSNLVASQLARAARGAIMDGLNTAILSQCEIPLPELPDQHRITAQLEQADRLRRARHCALELSDAFLPAIFLQLFGDPSKNPKRFRVTLAGEIFEIQLGKMLDTKRFTGTHLRRYLGNANVQWGRFDLNDLKEMDFNDQEFAKFKLIPGDLLVCEGGEVGRTAIWSGQIPDCCYQKALHRLRPKTGTILSEYFLHFMRAAVQTGLVARATSTATIAHFTAERFDKFEVIVPPLPLQQSFARLAKRIQRLRLLQQESLRQAEHLYSTLLHLSFTTEMISSRTAKAAI